MKTIILCVGILLAGCGNVQGCPPKTAQVTLACRDEIKAGTKTKEQCYTEIEASCP